MKKRKDKILSVRLGEEEEVMLEKLKRFEQRRTSDMVRILIRRAALQAGLDRREAA